MNELLDPRFSVFVSTVPELFPHIELPHDVDCGNAVVPSGRWDCVVVLSSTFVIAGFAYRDRVCKKRPKLAMVTKVASFCHDLRQYNSI